MWPLMESATVNPNVDSLSLTGCQQIRGKSAAVILARHDRGAAGHIWGKGIRSCSESIRGQTGAMQAAAMFDPRLLVYGAAIVVFFAEVTVIVISGLAVFIVIALAVGMTEALSRLFARRSAPAGQGHHEDTSRLEDPTGRKFLDPGPEPTPEPPPTVPQQGGGSHNPVDVRDGLAREESRSARQPPVPHRSPLNPQRGSRKRRQRPR